MSGAAFAMVDRGIPRKLSTRKGDRFFDAEVIDRLSDQIAVFFNGEELPEVASYDVDEGIVTRSLLTIDGHPIRDEHGVPALERLKGEVEVRWKKGTAA